MANIDFEQLTAAQRELVQSAYAGGCSGCAAYLGSTAAGDHTYFWHYGASDGYMALPVGNANPWPHYDYDSGNITVTSGQEFTTEGEEVLPPPFTVLVHFDIRKWHQVYKEQMERGGFASTEEEENFLACCQCNSGSIPPERVVGRLKLESGKPVAWIGHFWLNPGEMTDELKEAALAITVELPSGDRLEVL